jgi:hypothetical protein
MDEKYLLTESRITPLCIMGQAILKRFDDRDVVLSPSQNLQCNSGALCIFARTRLPTLATMPDWRLQLVSVR